MNLESRGAAHELVEVAPSDRSKSGLVPLAGQRAPALGNLLFQFINQAFPDPAAAPSAAEFTRQAIRWSVSYLVVAFPVFLGVSRLIGRELAADPSKRASKVRRWLTYLTLFVAAAVLIGDLTTLVYNLLGGDVTARFLLKVLTVGSIAGTAFWYYLSDLRADEREDGS